MLIKFERKVKLERDRDGEEAQKKVEDQDSRRGLIYAEMRKSS
jgi:hypothetical protein